MYIIFKYSNKKIAYIILSLCLVIQFIDIYPAMKEKFNYEEETYTIDKEWEQALEGTSHIVYLQIGEYIYEEMRPLYYKIAYIANENNCTLNNFYFAREITNVKDTSSKYEEDLKQGNLEKENLYIIKQKDENVWWNEQLNAKKIDGYIVIIPNRE